MTPIAEHRASRRTFENRARPMRLGKNQLFFLMWAASFIVAFALPDNPGQSAVLGGIISAIGMIVPTGQWS
ncbi:MAG: hypothetical protein F9K21_10660 [Rhodocyclaceae bacterium]|nr:MAG: hypothetical protein F9K21_10660 [Rhodocyclaceae bacterium]